MVTCLLDDALMRAIGLIVAVRRYNCVITGPDSARNTESTTAVMRSLQDMMEVI